MAYDFTDPNFDWDKWTQEQFGSGSDFAQQFTTPAPDFTNVALPSLETPEYQQQIQEQVLKDIESTKQPSYVSTGSGLGGIGKIFGAVLAVASLAIPGLGEIVGAAILDAVGITGATAAVEAGVGAAALSAGSTAAQGGNVEDVLKNAATAGFASGINVGLGGGVTGAAAGSLAGSAIQGGSVDQVLVNAVAAGAGAGVQGVLGPAAGTITRDLIKTGNVSDQTLINAAAAEIGAFNKPGDRSAPIVEGQPMAPPAEAETVPTSISLDSTAETSAAAPETSAATLPPVTVTAPTVAPTVTDVDVMKQVAAEQPTETLPQVTVTGKKEEFAPTVTDITEVRPDTTRGLPAPTAELPPVTITGKREEDTSPTVTELPPVTVTGERDPTVEFPPVTITGKREPDVELDPVTITGKREYELDPVTIIGKREDEVAPPITELDPVTIVGKKDPIYELDPVTITGKPDVEFDPVTITGKKEDDVIIEDPLPEKKEPEEKPKSETKKVYPTITSVPPPKKPRAPPIITGASPARLLADALAAYRPSGAIEGEESGKERQNVWNEKSLRLKDALGL